MSSIFLSILSKIHQKWEFKDLKVAITQRGCKLVVEVIKEPKEWNKFDLNLINLKNFELWMSSLFGLDFEIYLNSEI